MRLSHFRERPDLADLDLHRAAFDHVEQGAGAGVQLLDRGDIVEQFRPGEEQRASPRQPDRLEGGAGPEALRS